MPEAHEHKPRVKIDVASRVSTNHSERNEDAVLGDEVRLQSDILHLPPIDALPEEDVREIIDDCARKEYACREKLERRGIAALADGVSGPQDGSGAIASRIAMAAVAEMMAIMPESADASVSETYILHAIRAAHDEVKAVSARFEKAFKNGAYATIEVTRTRVLEDGAREVTYGHVGDGRICRYTPGSGRLEQLTTDHNPLSDLVASGRATQEEAEEARNSDPWAVTDPQKKELAEIAHCGTVTNIVGHENLVQRGVDTGNVRLEPGERLLIMSDGLKVLDDDEIIDILKSGGGIKEILDLAETPEDAKRDEDIDRPDDMSLIIIE